MDSIELIVKEQGIETSSLSTLAEAFGAPFTSAGEILSTYREIEVNDASQTELMKEAKTKRLALKKVRTTVENKRKDLKEESLRTGKAIDAVARYIKDQIVPAEDYLEQQEKFTELVEEKRLIAVKIERIELLTPYTDNPSAYADPALTDDAFTELLNGLKATKELEEAKTLAYETEQRRIREEKEAEDARIREENVALKAELEAKQAEELQNQAAQKQEKDMQAKLASAPDKEKLLAFISELEVLEVPTDTSVATRITAHIKTSIEMYRKLINEQL